MSPAQPSLPIPPPAPRRFRFGAVDATAKFLMLFGGIWGGVGLLLAGIFTVAGGPVWQDWILDRRGVPAQATPVAVEPTSARINSSRVYRIAYSFVDRDGAPQTGAGRTTRASAIARARHREPLAVEYDPQRPALSRIAGDSASLLGLTVFFPGTFAAVGCVIFALGYRRLRKVRAIYVHGEAVRAEVVSVSPTNMRVNGRRIMRVAYVFDCAAARVPGKTTGLFPAPPVGAAIWILYDPSDPGRNVAA